MYLLGPWPNAWMTDRSFLQCFSYPGEIRAYIRGDGAYFNTSSRSEKTNITSLGNSLGTLGKIQGVSYDWKGDQFSKKQNLGFIAEDLAEALPQAVSADGKMVNYSAVIPVLVEGVKEMHQIVKAQETALAAKDRQIESLGQRLAALEKTVQALASQQPGGNR